MMKKTDAEKFIQQLFDDVWIPLNAEKIGDFYHQDLIAHINKQIVGFDDVVHRCHFVKEHYREWIFEIDDVLCDDDKIIVRLNQTGIRKEQDKEEHYLVICVYQLLNCKVKQMWALIVDPVNYLE